MSVTIAVIALGAYIAGIISMSASGYGMGKEDSDKQGPKYKAAVSFFVIGLVVLLVSTSVLIVIL